jgi:protein ImuB
VSMGFAAIYIPEFMVQANLREKLREHSREKLREKLRVEPSRGLAIALIDGNAPLFSVVAANAGALDAGICLGMTKANAAQFAGVEIWARSVTAEKTAHAALRDVGWSVSPRVEETAADLIILDVAGLTALLGSKQQIAELLVARAGDCGLRVNVAMTENISVAEVAARGFAGITLIAAGEEAARIGELPISVLLPSEEIAETLELWGIKTCGALARLPVLQLSERLGQTGVRLRALARGTASRALVVAEAELVFEEEMELDDAVAELEPLSFVLGRLLNQLCARLTARALAASLLRVRFDLQPAFENALDVRTEVVRTKSLPGIYERTMQLPVPMRDAKLLLKLLRLRLQGSPPGAPIVKVLVAAEAAPPRVAQRGLFSPGFPDMEKLELTLARLAGVVGEGNVGSAEVVDTHRSGEFRMERFLPVREEAGRESKKKLTDKNGVGRKNANESEKHFGQNAAAMSFRVFRPPQAVTVKLREEKPAEIFLLGRRGEVQKASGPWRTSGEWWREEQWIEDEWDLEVRFDGGAGARTETEPQKRWRQATRMAKENISKENAAECARYRVYFDAVRQAWFARGMYD